MKLQFMLNEWGGFHSLCVADADTGEPLIQNIGHRSKDECLAIIVAIREQAATMEVVDMLERDRIVQAFATAYIERADCEGAASLIGE